LPGFSLAALLGMILLTGVSSWAKKHRTTWKAFSAKHVDTAPKLSTGRITASIAILMALLFSKFVYLASLTSYYTFYLSASFNCRWKARRFICFVFLGAVAAGTLIGGPVGDRIGRKSVIWVSILGVLPFTLLLPYANLFWTEILSVVIGLILASAFSGDRGVRAGTRSGKSRNDLRPVFWICVRRGGIGRGAPGLASRFDQRQFCVHGLFVSSAMGLLAAFLPNIERPRVGSIHEEAMAE